MGRSRCRHLGRSYRILGNRVLRHVEQPSGDYGRNLRPRLTGSSATGNYEARGNYPARPAKPFMDWWARSGGWKSPTFHDAVIGRTSVDGVGSGDPHGDGISKRPACEPRRRSRQRARAGAGCGRLATRGTTFRSPGGEHFAAGACRERAVADPDSRFCSLRGYIADTANAATRHIRPSAKWPEYCFLPCVYGCGGQFASHCHTGDSSRISRSGPSRLRRYGGAGDTGRAAGIRCSRRESVCGRHRVRGAACRARVGAAIATRGSHIAASRWRAI